MQVTIADNGKTIWMRNEDAQEGIASRSYLKEGTQHKIMAALENALVQAKGQMQLADDVN